jgi:4a-hydroxytetrahydrobiopterin dehydratase
VGYAQVTVKLQTHKVRAITNMDFDLARKIEEVVTWLPDEGSALDGYPKKWIH